LNEGVSNMFNRGIFSVMVVGGMMLAPGLASAAFVSADFRSEFDLPDFVGPGPRVFEALNEPVAGAPDLSSVNQIANPNNWAGSATTDLDSSGLVTLTGDQELAGFANFDLAIFQISNIVFSAGETITGLSVVSSGLLDTFYGLGVIAPVINFTANSVTITYDTTGANAITDFQFLDGGASTFQINTSNTPTPTVPVPAALPLMAGALGLAGLMARRAKKV
jgi:hypothetical protein